MPRTSWATREKPIDVRRRLRELYERVTADGDGMLVGYQRAAQWLGGYGFQPRLVGKAGVLASRWSVARWLKAWRVPVLWRRINRDEARRLGLQPGRYPCVTKYMLLGAIFEAARWPFPRDNETGGSDATIPSPARPLPPSASQFTCEGWRRYGRPGRRVA